MSNWSYFGAYEYFRRLFSKDARNQVPLPDNAAVAMETLMLFVWVNAA